MVAITKSNIEAIDFLKGLVLVLMALDYCSDYVHYSAFYFDVGDPNPFKQYGTYRKDLISFLNPSRCPSSLNYLLMTLGVAFLLVSTAEKLKGKSADFLIIDGNPSKNSSAIRKVLFVFKSGVGFSSKKLFDAVKGKVGFN